MINEWFVDSQKKKKGHSRLWFQPSDQRTHPRNQHLKRFFNSLQSKKDRTIGDSQDLFGLFMTLGFAVLLTMVIIRFRSLQKKKTSSHISPQNKDRQEGGKTFSPHKKQQPQSTHAKA